MTNTFTRRKSIVQAQDTGFTFKIWKTSLSKNVITNNLQEFHRNRIELNFQIQFTKHFKFEGKNIYSHFLEDIITIRYVNIYYRVKGFD